MCVHFFLILVILNPGSANHKKPQLPLCSAETGSTFFPTLVRYIIILSCDFSTFCLKCLSQNAERTYVTQEFSLNSSLEYCHKI